MEALKSRCGRKIKGKTSNGRSERKDETKEARRVRRCSLLLVLEERPQFAVKASDSCSLNGRGTNHEVGLYRCGGFEFGGDIESVVSLESWRTGDVAHCLKRLMNPKGGETRPSSVTFLENQNHLSHFAAIKYKSLVQESWDDKPADVCFSM